MGRTEHRGMSRRDFVGISAVGGAALVAGVRPVFAASGERPIADREDAAFIEATIPELQRLMRRGALSSRDLTRAYIDRIESGPSGDWRTASRTPVGLAPSPASAPEPVVQV